MTQVFLTGATGFIGQALVRHMRQRAWVVHALVRDPKSAPAQWLLKQGCTLVPGDVTHSAGLQQAMAGMDAVVHNAGVYELGANAALRERMQHVNVTGTDNVLGAALAAQVPRTVYVSTVWGLGPSGRTPAPPAVADETQRHDGHYLTAYERSKAEAHQRALAWRGRGLPLVIGMPNGVMGANDHSFFGYALRLHLLGAMFPMAFGADGVYALVDVEALADGLCLAAEKAPPGEDYVFCGEAISIRQLFAHWATYPGGMKVRLWLPRWFMRPQMALLEPLQRLLGMPAFFSRDVVDCSGAHLNFSSAKAKRELGWTHPGVEQMWSRIISQERQRMASRSGFLNKLRHQSVSDLS